METFEDFLKSASTLRHTFDIDALRFVTRVLQDISLHIPHRFDDFHREVSRCIGKYLPDWVVEHHHLMSIKDRYVICGVLSSAAVTATANELAMEYWSPMLVENRPPKKDDLVGISADVAGLYDGDPAHRQAAYDLCAFANSTKSNETDICDVLDLCCGTGLHADYLTGYRKLVGIDLELDGLIQNGRAEKYTDLIKGDVTVKLTRLEGAFDMIILGGASYFFKNLDWLFEQAARLMKPQGVLVFNSYPCPDSADQLVTPSGNFRYCHSDRYLRAVASRYGLIATHKSWHVVFHSLPNWFWCFGNKCF